MPDSTRILLADDHAILRAGLRLLIDKQPGLHVVGEAGDGREALAQTRALQPDLILLDLNMPELDGLSALPLLKDAAPNCRVLILTMLDDADHLRAALQAGAAGYVLKKAVDSELINAVQAVLRGETYVHSALTDTLLHAVLPESAPPSPASPDHPDPWQALSEREREVLRRVAGGYTNAEIAGDLFLSVKTVETYRSRGMAKLGVETRAQLVKSALKHGVLD